MTTVIEIIANWAASNPAFSDVARRRAREAIADTLGCMFIGRTDFSTAAARTTFGDAIHDSGASAVAGGGRASMAIAACINGTACHALDYDDNFHPAISHASAVLVPALLAVGQARGVDGRTLADAYLIGLEAQAIVGRGVNPGHYRLGWHATSTVGCIGTAAGAAWLMGSNASGIARAMSVAASMASGMKGQFGTPVKPLHAGLAARNAVEAAQFGAAGMTGRLDILTCPQGFLELFGDSDAPGWSAPCPGEPHSIESHGLLPKRHPCCGSAHNTIDALLDLKASHGFRADDVAAVHTIVGIANARNLSYDRPEDEMQARFSMNYCAALALTQDRLCLADFTNAAIEREPIRMLLPRVTMQARPAEEERLAPDRLPHCVTVTLINGDVHTRERHHAKGSLADPFDDIDRYAKFSDCTHAMPAAARERLFSRLLTLDDLPDLKPLEPIFGMAAPE